MTKVVVNRCFGGFGLSAKAYKRLAELQGMECYFFKGFEEKESITLEEAQKQGLFFDAFNIPNPQDYSQKDFASMSKAEREESNRQYRAIRINDMSDDRTNPLLIQVVEELGEEADGQCAKLEIVEIPDGIEWEIDEYDGNESIDEKHRSW